MGSGCSTLTEATPWVVLPEKASPESEVDMSDSGELSLNCDSGKDDVSTPIVADDVIIDTDQLINQQGSGSVTNRPVTGPCHRVPERTAICYSPVNVGISADTFEEVEFPSPS